MVLAAVGQICSRNNVARNLAVCRSVLARAAAAGAQFVCLPEAADYICPSDEVVKLAQTLDDNSFVRGIQEQAKQSKVWVSVGIHELPSSSSSSSSTQTNGQQDKPRVYNTQCLISPEGKLASVYRKLHLFDVNFKGGMQTSESNTTMKGSELSDITQTAIGKVGMLTCYDLRFPEVALLARQQGAEIITYPSAFATQTGMAHWDPLLRARAIETQSYVLAAAQVGSHPPTSRSSYGAACIVDPWGSVLARCHDNQQKYENQEDDESGSYCMADIDLEYMAKIRKEMPLWHQRRPEVYGKINQRAE